MKRNRHPHRRWRDPLHSGGALLEEGWRADVAEAGSIETPWKAEDRLVSLAFQHRPGTAKSPPAS